VIVDTPRNQIHFMHIKWQCINTYNTYNPPPSLPQIEEKISQFSSDHLGKISDLLRKVVTNQRGLQKKIEDLTKKVKKYEELKNPKKSSYRTLSSPPDRREDLPVFVRPFGEDFRSAKKSCHKSTRTAEKNRRFDEKSQKI
jgi:hypothetical protein